MAGSTMIPKKDGSTSDGALVVAESTFASGMFEMPLHLHRETAESLYLFSGHLSTSKSVRSAGTPALARS